MVVAFNPRHLFVSRDQTNQVEDTYFLQCCIEPSLEEVVILEKGFSSRDFKFARGTFFTTLVRLERRKNRNKGPPI